MELNIKTNTATASAGITFGDISISTTTSTYNPYGEPYLVKTLVYPDRIELIYRADSNITLTSYPPQTPDPKIFKMIYPFKAEEVTSLEGRLVAPTTEYYDFD